MTEAILRSMLVAVALAAPLALAKQIPLQQGSKNFGSLEVYYSSFPSSFLKPKTAAAYDLSRGPNLGIVNISLKANAEDDALAPLRGRVTGSFRDLLRSHNLQFREIVEQGAIYYLATFRFGHRDKLFFDVEVMPEGQTQTYQVDWQSELFRSDR